MTEKHHILWARRGCAIFFILLIAVVAFTGCGEKKGEKEYEEGINFYTVQQYESAVKQFAAAANLGHAEAQNQLGKCFAEGKGVKQDDAEAIKWFRKAAEQGIAESQYILGCAYNEGIGGLPVDLEEAAKWLEKAAKQGNTEAQNVLDPIKKVVKLLESAKKGDTDAMFALSVAFYNGDGVKKNRMEAVRWAKKAAENGDATSMYNLYLFYTHGDGVKQDMQEAINWLIKAGDKGYPQACIGLGLEYSSGKNVKKDYAEAVKWYKMGLLLLKGRDLSNNLLTSQDLQRIAAEGLAMIYQEGGNGVQKDMTEAVKWYRRAAELGSSYAKNKLKELDGK